MYRHKALALSILTTLAVSSAQAQTTYTNEPKSDRINSPYTRFGIGNLGDNRSPALRGMGGIANGYAKEYTLNAYNPASYTYLARTTFEFAFDAQNNTVRIGDDRTSSSTVTIGHFNLAIPLKTQRFAINLGYMPFSKVYYNSQDTATVAGTTDKILQKYNGEGSLNFGYLGISGGTKGFSVGVNGGYVFGNIRNSSYINFLGADSLHTRISDYSKKDIYGGLFFKAGVLYKAKLKNSQYISIGATGTLSQRINITRDEYYVAGTQPPYSGAPVVTDTISALYQQKGKMELPSEFGFGVHYGKGANYDFGVDLVYADWSTFKRFGATENEVGNNAYRVAFGGEVTPNARNSKQYLSMMTYRLGGYMGKDYVYYNSTAVNYYGFTLGTQLPLRSNINTDEQGGALNLSLDMGNRGTINNGLASEFYIKFTAGLRINAHWFQRRAYQ
ncbi:MAG: hypothetical protein BGO31_09595 [Bacteroidetes bacterium 43-16]|nr:MAG: hypothetical protein BGO31_09595 [Bacteroidetes bacterium 43-16]